MRRGFHFVLMVVLVLRGLMGTAMAAGMLPSVPASPAPSPVHGATGAHHAPASSAQAAPAGAPHGFSPAIVGVPDAGHDQGHEHGHDHDHDHDHGHNNNGQAPAEALPTVACHGATDATGACSAHSHHTSTCSACDICHSAMLEAPAALSPAPTPQRSALPRAFAQFASAPAARAIKPPIA
ncbi:hypothetical protein [Acidovorax sp. LjRoot194]|uniref:hypothetical protein n=1 Tax=Acidovorax sp. LjRoot194 TaxID=3342280 RepID=UPI003ECD1E9E